MLRRISVLLLSALLTVGLTVPVALAQPANRDGCEPGSLDLLCDKGQPGSDEEKVTGPPGTHVDENGDETLIADDWGSVASALGDAGVMGDHNSDPVQIGGSDGTGCFGDNREHNCRETPRDGLGNVAMNDFDDHNVPVASETTDCDQIPEGDTQCEGGDGLFNHACIAAAAALPGTLDEEGNEVQPDCTAEPGGNRGPGHDVPE